MAGEDFKQRPMLFEGFTVAGMDAVTFTMTDIARVGHDHPFEIVTARLTDECLKLPALFFGAGGVVDDRALGQCTRHPAIPSTSSVAWWSSSTKTATGLASSAASTES